MEVGELTAGLGSTNNLLRTVNGHLLAGPLKLDRANHPVVREGKPERTVEDETSFTDRLVKKYRGQRGVLRLYLKKGGRITRLYTFSNRR